MDKKMERALEIAAQISVAKASNSSAPVNKESGQRYGEFFSEIYKAVLEIENQDSTES